MQAFFPQFSLVFICGLGSIKVLSKLDPAGVDSLGNSQCSCIRCCISDIQAVDFLLVRWTPYVDAVSAAAVPETFRRSIITFVGYDESMFAKG